MDLFKILILVCTVALSGACSSKMTSPQYTLDNVPRENAYVSRELPPVVPIKRTQIKEIDPFEGRLANLAASRSHLHTVLYSLANDLGLNLVVSPDVDQTTSITANFNYAPAKDAVNVVMELGDAYYEVQGNILRVYKYHTTNFNLPYLAIGTGHDSTMGGDVIGGADKEGDTNLEGSFTATYTKAESDSDFYGQLQENIASILAGDPNSSFTINKLAGIVSVHSTRSLTKKVNNLLDNIVTNSVRQVQIEAKVVEVVLNDSWSYGIDWAKIFVADGNRGVAKVGNLLPDGMGSINLTWGSFTGALNAVAEYGQVDTLSNPRLTVLHGHSAIITAGTITPYWEIERERETTATTSSVTTTYTKYNVLDGLMLGLTAFIHDDGKVMLNIVPIITKLSGVRTIEESGVIMAEAPLIDVKEAGTVVQVEDGAMLVIGGLISNVKYNSTKSVPLLGDLPLLGYLFSSDKVEYQKKELVIFIKPTVIYGDSKVVIK